MARRRRGRAPRAPRAQNTPAPSFGASAAGAAAGAFGASSASRFAGSYAFAMGSGGAFSLNHHLSDITNTLAAGMAFIPGGQAGAAALGFGGNFLQQMLNGKMEAANRSAMTMAQTGMTWDTLNPYSAAFSGMRDPWSVKNKLNGFLGEPIGQPAANQGLGMLAPMMATGGGMEGPGGMLQAMVARYGSPANPAFQYAANAFMATQADPFSAAGFAAGMMGNTVGLGSISAAYNTIGPSQTLSAVLATRNPTALSTFQNYNVRARTGDILSNVAGSIAGVAGITAAASAFSGSSDMMDQAYRTQIGALGGLKNALSEQIDFYAEAGKAGDPYALQRVGQLKMQRASVSLASIEARFQEATRPADASAQIQMSRTSNAIALSGMDVLRGGQVPSGLRRQYIAQLLNEVSRMDTNAEGNPAAQAANEGRRSSLLQEVMGQRVAEQFGDMGQLINNAAGAPTGYQGWGASSVRRAQGGVPGTYRMIGGSGTNVGTSPEVNLAGMNLAGNMQSDPQVIALLTRLVNAVEGSRAPSTGGGSGDPFTLTNNRVQGKIGK